MDQPPTSQTHITGDPQGPVYTGNIGQVGDRNIDTGGGDHFEGGTHHHHPPAPPTPRPAQSPRRVDHFVDRVDELADLVRDAHPGRILTLSGPGGMGKSALVAEAIHHLAAEKTLAARFPDGVIFHDFYVEPAADQALAHIARSYAEPIDRDGVQSAARRALAGRTALLLLDGAENCDQLDRVTAVAGHCGVIITTRRPNDAPGDATTLPPLPAHDAVDLIAQWANITADAPTVPSPPPSPVHAGRDREGSLPRIAALVGYLPLALRLVGRYLAHQQESPAAYLAWLQETPLDALGEGKARREESVPYLIERSLRFVDDDARRILAVAGMVAFAPIPRSLFAVAFAVAENNLRRPLAQLVDYGLIQPSAGGYTLAHALIHTYARQRLSAPAEVLARLVEHYNGLFRRERENGPAGFARLDAHRPHLLALAGHCAGRAAWASVRRLVWAARDYLDLAGYGTDRVALAELGIQAARAGAAAYDEMAFLNSLGLAYRNLGQVAEAIGYHEGALAIARQIGDKRGEGSDLGNLGNAYYALGQVVEAIDYYEGALAIARQIGDRRGEGNHLGNLGIAYHDLGQVAEAIDCYEGALAIARQIGDKRGEGNRLGSLGGAYRQLGQVAEAIDYYEGALAIARQIGDRRNEGIHLGNLGNAYSDLGQVAEAIDCYEGALAIARQIGDKRGEGIHLGNLGNAYSDLGQVAEAIDYYEGALAIARQIGDKRSEGIDLGNLGRLHAEQGASALAIDYCQQSLAISQQTGDRPGEGIAFNYLGYAYQVGGACERAIDLHRQAVQILRAVGYRQPLARTLVDLAEACLLAQEPVQAAAAAGEALTLTQDIGDPMGQALAHKVLGQIGQAGATPAAARSHYQQALALFEQIKSPHAHTVRRWLNDLPGEDEGPQKIMSNE